MKRIHTPNKKLWLVIGLVAGIIVLISYGGLSFYHWRAIDRNSAQLQKDNEQLALQAIDPSRKSDQRRQAIAQLAAASNDIASLCHSSWIYQWQASVVPGARKTRESCLGAKTKLTNLTNTAQAVDHYLESEHKLIEILSALVIETKTLSEKSYTEAAANVLRATIAIEELDVSQSLEPVKTEAEKRVNGIKSAWSKLLAADKKQDKVTYTVAVDELDQAYANLASIPDKADQQLSRVMKDLVTTTNQL